MSGALGVSVVICTYRRPETLAVTLESLQRQEYGEFEIIVVNNDADRAVERDIEAFNASARVPVRCVHHPEGGNSGARNRGVAESSGDVVLFTDDDVTVAPHWVETYARAFAEEPDMAVAGGPVRPRWLEPPPSWLLEYIDGREEYPQLALLDLGDRFILRPDTTVYGCNMGLRRGSFEIAGFHPEIYGPRTLGDGEWGLWDELRVHGILFGYLPGAAVEHHIPAGRMTVAYLRRWAWHHGGAIMYRRLRGKIPSAMGALVEAARCMRRHGVQAAKGLALWGRTDRISLDAQFRTSQLAYELRYLYWWLYDPFVRHLLTREETRA